MRTLTKEMEYMYDVIIIGGGITGSSIAYEFSKYNLKVAMVEASNDVGASTTKANSGIVHAGYDPKPGTLMAKLNVEGSKMYKELAPKFNVHYSNIGSLVIGKKSDEDKILELYNRGLENGVSDMSILRGEEIFKLEPNLNKDITIALLAQSAAVVSPWEMCLAFSENAVRNGVELFLSFKVTNVTKVNDYFTVESKDKVLKTKFVINCAGVYADEIYNMVLKDQKGFKIVPVKGDYYLLDKEEGKLVNHIIFQTPSSLGKGVLVSKTCHGNLIVGPNAKEIMDKEDVGVDQESLDYIKKMAKNTLENINYRNNIRNFAGLRAKILDYDDFLIGDSLVSGFINFAGIKSPGLSAAPAFGPYAKRILMFLGLPFELNNKFKITPLPKFFKDMTKEEIDSKIKENELYGRIICRCETVSEGEIVDSLKRPIPALSIDAIKRRCNARMGRCQGGFCGPKILEIMTRELNLEPKDILQDKEGTNIVLDYTKGGIHHEGI
jgi:glycerol-3-phosphate dehydrogenase